MYRKTVVKLLKDRENPEDWDENGSSCTVEHQYDISDQKQFYMRKKWRPKGSMMVYSNWWGNKHVNQEFYIHQNHPSKSKQNKDIPM